MIQDWNKGIKLTIGEHRSYWEIGKKIWKTEKKFSGEINKLKKK